MLNIGISSCLSELLLLLVSAQTAQYRQKSNLDLQRFCSLSPWSFFSSVLFVASFGMQFILRFVLRSVTIINFLFQMSTWILAIYQLFRIIVQFLPGCLINLAIFAFHQFKTVDETCLSELASQCTWCSGWWVGWCWWSVPSSARSCLGHPWKSPEQTAQSHRLLSLCCARLSANASTRKTWGRASRGWGTHAWPLRSLCACRSACTPCNRCTLGCLSMTQSVSQFERLASASVGSAACC